MHVAFAVEDVTRAVEFHEHALGWPRNDRIDFEEYVELHPPDGRSLGLCEEAAWFADPDGNVVAVARPPQ